MVKVSLFDFGNRGGRKRIIVWILAELTVQPQCVEEPKETGWPPAYVASAIRVTVMSPRSLYLLIEKSSRLGWTCSITGSCSRA